MTMQIRVPKWTSMMLLILAFVVLNGCGENGADKESGEISNVLNNAADQDDAGTANLPELAESGQESDVAKPQSGKHAALEQLGTYLEYLLKEGDREELEQYVISRTLTWDEAAAMADLSPAFAHFSGYAELRFNSAGAILVEADVNGDGLKDLIEYLPDVGDNGDPPYMIQDSLTIYENRGEQGYGVMYFQPCFDTRVGCFEYIFVLQYDGGIYCMFEKNKIPLEKGPFISIYQIQDGALTGRLIMDYEYTDVDCEVLFCKSGMEEWAEELSRNAMDYYMEDYRLREKLFVGDAEEILEKESEEYAFLERIGMEEAEEYRNRYLDRYRELTGSENLYASYAAGFVGGRGCRSDLDNDGEPELYAQMAAVLGLHGGFRCRIFLTGELYGNGKHEAESGLIYSMENEGERTDFEKLCGLDIWSSDDIPQAFWVERCGEENITFMKYYDRHYFTCLIEGYCIKEGSYETVLSIRCRPMISNAPVYEWHDENEDEGALSYTIHLPDGRDIRYPYPVLYGLQDMEIQNQINDTMEALLQEKIDTFFEWEEGQERRIWDGAWCNVLYAAKEKLVLNYIICYEHEGWERVYGEDVCLEIDLMNGEVLLSDYWESEYRKCDPWTSAEGRTFRVEPTW